MSVRPFPNQLAERNVLLVGGTSDIGMSVASALLSRGARVILTSTRQAKLEKSILALKSAYPDLNPPPSVTGYTLDLSSAEVETNLSAFFSRLEADDITKLHHLVYLAADPLPTVALEDVTLEKWHKANQVRTISALLTVKHARAALKKGVASSSSSTGQGSDKVVAPSIVFTGGSISEKPMAGGWAMLSIIAGGLVSLARQLAFDLRDDGIRVNTVAPGVVHTVLWDGMPQDERDAFLDGHRKSVPTGRVARPDDVAEAYLYLMSDANVTGQTVHTNSGVTLV